MPSSHSSNRSSPQGNGSRTASSAPPKDLGALVQAGEHLTTAQGLRLPDTDHSLKAGDRGPTLLEDFHLREKITHFDHERIPERVVHARGAAAHGGGDPVSSNGMEMWYGSGYTPTTSGGQSNPERAGSFAYATASAARADRRRCRFRV